MQILGFPDSEQPAQALARHLGCDYGCVELHRFPDGESRLTLPSSLSSSGTLIFRSLDHPNDKLVELYMLSRDLRERDIPRLGLIAPYLCYMRQDTAFHEGELISQQHIGHLLAQCFDDLITVDPHLHRTSTLHEAVPVKRALSLHPTTLMAEFLKTWPDAVLIGPDSESAQWVEAIARHSGHEHGVANKQRLGDRTVRIELPSINVKGRQLVLVDDMISTGHTLAQAAGALLERGADRVDCLVTHALLDRDAESMLHSGGIDKLWSTDAISHPSNVIALTSLIASAVSDLAESYR
ncbi:MAG: ribose-phosphate diphosphokinase [Gammaproteobacteria bacterium]|nr:ribose-phosphate diphosphokinase [Gammaproteobacteria bacterium]